MSKDDNTCAALTKAIRVFTVNAPIDMPNGPYEESVLALENALLFNNVREARRQFEKMCAEASKNTKALRIAAEAHFGGDFRSEPS